MAKILIIDDDRDFLESISIILKKDGHAVECKYDTQGIISKIKEINPDLIILDVIFPENESEGFEVAREIKNSESSIASIPILMLTAVNKKFPLGFSRKEVDSNWLPVSDFLEKPVDFDLLREKVRGLLRNQNI